MDVQLEKRPFQILGKGAPTPSAFLMANPYPSQGFRFWLRWNRERKDFPHDTFVKNRIESITRTYSQPLRSDCPETLLQALNGYERELGTLWADAARVVDPQQSTLGRLLSGVGTDQGVLDALYKLEDTEQERVGPFIWAICQHLSGEALEFAFDFEVWRKECVYELKRSLSTLSEESNYYKKTPWQKIEESAPAPRYPQDPVRAQALLDRLDQDQLKPTSKREANSLGADLMRAAAHFWNLSERIKAVDVFRALTNPMLCPDERGQRLLKAASQTFSNPPTTQQAVTNYLRKK